MTEVTDSRENVARSPNQVAVFRGSMTITRLFLVHIHVKLALHAKLDDLLARLNSPVDYQ
jgi:hypothetical protein